jgi:bacterioferritin (cytochrome b1)
VAIVLAPQRGWRFTQNVTDMLKVDVDADRPLNETLRGLIESMSEDYTSNESRLSCLYIHLRVETAALAAIVLSLLVDLATRR